MPSPKHFRCLFEFGPFRLDPAERLLLRDSKPVPLTLKAFDTLLFLVENRGRIVEKNELLAEVWTGTFVEEATLAQNIFTLRKTLGDTPEGHHYIETVPKRGYRFIAPVKEFWPDVREFVASGESVKPLGSKLYTHIRGALWGRVAVGIAVVIAVAVLTWGIRSYLVGVGDPHRAIHSLAVLPLVNLSHDPEQEYFADGMTDELITTLAKISELRVTSRTSVVRYRNAQKSLAQIGRELGVDAVIEGTVVRSGNKVRISAQLIHAATDRHLWAETYERNLDDVLSVQAEVGRDVAREIEVKLTADERARLAPAPTVNPEAYELYLKGRYLWNKSDQPSKSAEYFQQAIAKDPDYAAAYAGLAQAYGSLGSFVPPKEIVPRAKEAARKALELDPSLDEAHLALSQILQLYDWDWRGAEAEIQRAIELNPSNSTAYFWDAVLLLTLGRSAEALAQVRKAQRLDPVSPLTGSGIGLALYSQRQYDRAQEELENALQLEPNFVPSQLYLAWVYEEKGMNEQALAALRRMNEASGPGLLSLLYLAEGYAKARAPGEARNILKRVIAESDQKYVPAVYFAIVYAALGERDKAFAWLEKAYAERSGALCVFLRSPKFDSLRSDSRFQELLLRVGLSR